MRLGVPPFLRPGWVGAWWRAFGRGELRILALRREGDLAGVLPVCRRGRMLVSPTNWHTPVYGPVAEDREAARILLEGLLAERPRRLDLGFLDPDLPGLEQLRGLAGHYRFHERVVLRSPFLRIEGTWDEYLAARSSNLRQGIRRKGRRLEERGEVSFEVLEDGRGLPDALAEGFAVEASGWKGERGTAMASRPETRRFYEEIAAWAATAGILRLAFLRLDGRPIAFDLSLEDDRAHYLLKPGFDPEFGRLGPGTLLAARMVERSFRIGLDRYEFLGADDRDKLRWTDDRRDRVQAQMFAPTAAGRISRLLQTRARPAARAVRARLRR